MTQQHDEIKKYKILGFNVENSRKRKVLIVDANDL